MHGLAGEVAMSRPALDAKVQEIRERRTEAETEWNPILDEARKDRLCIAGKPWEALDPKGLQARVAAGRPHLALDELGQYVNQTVNHVRANPRGIKFAPTGNGANDRGAEFYQNHTREIEYRSHAPIAYSSAFEQAVASSIGWLRIRTKRAHLRTFDQDLWIEPIMNADQVLPSPGCVWPDARDLTYLFYIEPWPERDFVREFPKAEVKSFSPELRRVAPGWGGANTVQVAEYWALQTVLRRLVAFQMPGRPDTLMTALVDELPGGKLPEGVENLRDEQAEDTTVSGCLTNGIEILEEIPWKGKHIPFVSCIGKSLYTQSAVAPRQILSMTRLARDPYMLYCYIRTCEAEAIGGVPRSQWVGYKGQFADPDRWEKANHQPLAFVEALERTELTPPNAILPLPTRQPWDPPLQNLDLAAEAARRAIQAAMGISPLPTSAQRQNEKSGVALRQIESSGQRGAFHFVDHYDLMIERTGVILEDLMDRTLDTSREGPIRAQDDSASLVRINDPRDPDAVSTKGSYRVTVSTGPASDSQREVADDFVAGMVSNLATIAQMAGPQVALQVLAKAIKLKQLGPIGDEIVDLLVPQPLGEDGKPLPPAVMKLMGENQHLKQLVQQAAQEKQAKVIELQGKGAIEAQKQQHEDARATEANTVKMAIAKMEDRLARLELELQAHEGAADREQERLLVERGHEQALEQGMHGHQQQMEAGDVGHQHAMEQQARTPHGSGAGA